MKYILAIDSFKGCMSSIETEQAASEAFGGTGDESISIPMSDGGDGMLEAFLSALHGSLQKASVHDPLMRPIEAEYGIGEDGTAIIETARANGLTLMKEDERNPLIATSYGVGELIACAINKGCRKFIVGLGGSGTSDAGTGMLKALVDNFAKGKTIDDAKAGMLGECSFTLACDVRNPLCGPQGAARIYGPQKGASTEDMIKQLDDRAMRFAEYSARHYGYDRSQCQGAGAAGGLGYAFLQYMNATFTSGADLLLDIIHFDNLLKDSSCVITGEGSSDRQTLMGKLPERILQRARRQNVPVWLIAGHIENREILVNAGFSRVACINSPETPLHEALKPDVARQNIRATVRKLISQSAI